MPEYYLLDQEHKQKFLPFLNTEDRTDPNVEVLGVVEDNTAAGALAFSGVGEGDAQIRSLAVAANWRRRGLASGMLEELRRIMPDLGYYRLSAIVTDEREQLPVLQTLVNSDFYLEDGMPAAECPLSALLDSPVMKPFLGKERRDVIPLGKVPDAALKKLNAELMNGGHLRLPLEWDRFSPALSFCAMPKEAEVASCVCIHSWESGVYVDWAYARPAAAKTLMSVLAASLSAASAEYGPEGLCSAALANEAGANLMRKLAGDAVKVRNTLRFEMKL